MTVTRHLSMARCRGGASPAPTAGEGRLRARIPSSFPEEMLRAGWGRARLARLFLEPRFRRCPSFHRLGARCPPGAWLGGEGMTATRPSRPPRPPGIQGRRAAEKGLRDARRSPRERSEMRTGGRVRQVLSKRSVGGAPGDGRRRESARRGPPGGER